MLTLDTLNKSEALKGLTEDQKKAIEEMSRNDENTVISTKIGELHGRYDIDIKEMTGIDKNGGEKSYDYLKRVLSSLRDGGEKYKSLSEELDAERKKSAELEEKVKRGADEYLKKQLADANARSEQLQAALAKSAEEITGLKADHEKAMKEMLADNELNTVIGGLKFKANVTEGMKSVMIAAAKAEVLSKGDIEVQTQEGGARKVVIRGKDGNLLNNPANNLNPYTLTELFNETCIKDIIDTGRRITGGGTHVEEGGGSGSELDLSGAKTQVEADNIIESYLLKSGVTRDSSEFSERSIKIRTEAKVSELPIQ